MLGFSEEEMEELQEQAFFDEIEARRDDPEMLQGYLDHMGFSEDDAEAFANAAETGDFDAMKDILEDGGYGKVEKFAQEQEEESSAMEDSSDADSSDDSSE